MSDALLHALDARVERLSGDLIEARQEIAGLRTKVAALEAKERMRTNPYAALGDQTKGGSGGGPLTGPWGYLATPLKLDGA